MDTRSKKFKHSLWVKAFCVIASSALIFESVYCASAAASAFSFYGSIEAIDGKTIKLEDTSAFYNVACQYISSAASVAAFIGSDGLDEEISSHRDDEVNAALSEYLAKKASIIEGELYYVATHYDKDEDGIYDDAYNRYVETTTMSTTARSSEYTTEATSAVAESVTEASAQQGTVSTTVADKYKNIKVDSFAPKNVQIAQSILKNTSGLGFLEYEGLVRSDAFYEQSFEYENHLDLTNGGVFTWNTNDYGSMTYELSKNDALVQFTASFDNWRCIYVENIKSELSNSKATLESCVNFKYIIRDKSGSIYMTNTEDADKAATEVKNHNCYLIFKDGTCEISGFNGYEKTDGRSGIENSIRYSVGERKLTIVAYLDNPLAEGDMFYSLNRFFGNRISGNVGRDIAVAIIALAAAVMFLIILLCLCGHKNEVEGYSLSFIDRVPGDVHLAVLAGLIIGLGALVVILADPLFSFVNGFIGYPYYLQFQHKPYYEYYTWILAGISALCAAIWLVFTEWLASVVRTVKAGKPYFKNFLVVKLAVLLYRLTKRFIRCLRRVCKKLISVLSYKPKKFRRLLILAFAVYLLLNIILTAFLVAGNGVSLFGFLLLAALNGFVLYKGLKYFKALDEIIDAADSGVSQIPDTDKMPESLKSLSGSIRLNRKELREAVEKAVKDERTKTELITNVSHDLKTPLTAVISYVDLLKKCDITDETALGYISVLDEKSIKLKMLIEDLIEASKVSTGNVALNPVGINLMELAVQAIGEMNDLFEESNLEIRLSEPKEPPVIFADSQKTFRIIDNLLNNARKYSEPGSRVYVSVSSNDYYGVFEVKNISREPLNITPEELTERFVRGDKSRTNEGNGLGLSIAKDLCRLQNGKLVISIDGDLFKASVYLPLKGKLVFSGENNEEQQDDKDSSL